MPKSIEIMCCVCGQETLLRREPVYDGFTKIGESLSCMSCGHEYPNEESVPYKDGGKVEIFGEDERPQAVRVFDADQDMRNCRHCAHYLNNPFTQWCSLHRKEVASTDGCDRFSRKPAEDE